MATDPTSLPTVANIQQAKKDMLDINTFNVSNSDSFTDNVGKEKKTMQGIENDARVRVSQVLTDLGISGIKVLIQLSTEPLPNPLEYGEGQPLKFSDTLDEFTLIDGAWVEDGNVGDEIDITAASHLTLAQAQASDLQIGQYVVLTDRGGLWQVTDEISSDARRLSLVSGLYLKPDAVTSVSFENIADPSGTTLSSPAINAAVADARTPVLGDGTYKLDSTVVLTKPKQFIGNGANTVFVFDTGFSGVCFSLSPIAGEDPKNWKFGDFSITATATTGNIINLDIAAVGEYISKLTVESVISNTQTSGYFLELINTNPNIDGLFTSIIKDNWSFGGYYLNNIGDSVYFLRNTTTGNGYGYYVSQLPTAANVAIKDGNCTVSGNALYVDKGQNITFDNMQVECPSAFTGLGDALVYVNHTSGGLVSNVEITDCNLNTQGNPKYCVSLLNSDLVQIYGNDMYADVNNGGAHIVIGATAINTIVGRNKYYDSVNGNEVSPVIIDDGVGTEGIWRDTEPTLAGWASSDTVNFHSVGIYKQDGIVQMRGSASGTATNSGDTILTLPAGFRPLNKAYLAGVFAAPTQAVLQILPTGEVQCLTAGITSIYFNGVTWSTN